MKIFDLENLAPELYEQVGGKARGLAELSVAGLQIPRGFVVVGIDGSSDLEKVYEYYQKNKYENVAVRSSATNEDGAEFSNAGQYETYLNISQKEDLFEAISKCLSSLNGEVAATYSKNFVNAKSETMSVIIQEMVDAKFAGVIFTRNPITGRKEMVIEAVVGLGEALVAGTVQSDSFIVNVNNEIITTSKMIGSELILKLVEDAKIAQNHFNHELDVEWALDQEDKIVFLQARSITTLKHATIDEFDRHEFMKNTVFTTCNIGEMLPGAVTPLSLTTSVKAIDEGLRRMLVKAGAYKNFDEIKSGDCVVSFSNQLFFNLTTIYKMAVSIAGADKSSVEASICGKYLETPDLPWGKMGKLRRAFNGLKYFKFLLSRKKAMKKIVKLTNKLEVTQGEKSLETYSNIDSKLPKLDLATWYHYNTSAHSGAMSSALLIMLLPYFESEDEARSAIAGLLENIDDIESVDILRSMKRIARNVLKEHADSANFSPEQLSVIIHKDTSEIKESYDYFINRHGHRSIREAELRSQSWKNNQTGLMENILTVIKSGAEENPKRESNFEEQLGKLTSGKKFAERKGLSYLAKQSRQAVANREFTKSYFVKVVDKFKDSYHELAKQMLEEGYLNDTDLIYFLTHEEILLVLNGAQNLIQRAVERRELLDEQMELKFNDVYVKIPTPVVIADIEVSNGTTLKGAPISRGIVEGRARIVKNELDAKQLQEGEIMVASFTDIGWSPYYSIISGLVTEVGSALSHGAVVAREYSLPLVVNVSNATYIIKTGDLIHLDANRGIITLLEKNE